MRTITLLVYKSVDEYDKSPISCIVKAFNSTIKELSEAQKEVINRTLKDFWRINDNMDLETLLSDDNNEIHIFQNGGKEAVQLMEVSINDCCSINDNIKHISVLRYDHTDEMYDELYEAEIQILGAYNAYTDELNEKQQNHIKGEVTKIRGGISPKEFKQLVVTNHLDDFESTDKIYLENFELY